MCVCVCVCVCVRASVRVIFVCSGLFVCFALCQEVVAVVVPGKRRWEGSTVDVGADAVHKRTIAVQTAGLAEQSPVVSKVLVCGQPINRSLSNLTTRCLSHYSVSGFAGSVTACYTPSWFKWTATACYVVRIVRYCLLHTWFKRTVTASCTPFPDELVLPVAGLS